jgi:chaperone required for assembly of F1-ATPase
MATIKRFWQQAALVQRDGLYEIELDARPMRLPGGPLLSLRQRRLAEAIAAEWQQAGGTIGGKLSADDVPLTRLAGTAYARIAPDPAPTAAALAHYAATDSLCYRAAQPEALVIRQHHAWQPWLDWAAATYGARLLVTADVMPIEQPPESLAALHAATAEYDAFALAGLGILVPSFGSLVLGLAVAAGCLTAAEAHELSLIDELYQEQVWGEDKEVSARRAHIRQDVKDAARFMALAAS